MTAGRRSLVAATTALGALIVALSTAPVARVAPVEIPSRLSDAAFWRMIVDFSELGGFFRSENLVSNETELQRVIPELQRSMAPGGVYVGVGPDQNFTYIAALRPKMAFIVDIRRQNMLLHLMHKALVEQSSDRAEFLSRLFSRKRPPGLGAESSPQQLFDAYRVVPPTETLFEKNLRSLVDHLVRRHEFPLASEEIRSIESIYRAFYRGGPELRYSYPRFSGFGAFPAYADLMTETDGYGVNRSYLGSEESFRALRQREQKNLIVPLVGNFAGDKTIQAIGRYLRERGATVTAFYASNVEQYLFQSDEWRTFFSNVAALPIDETSMFIRSCFTNTGLRPQSVAPGPRSTMLLDPIASLLVAFQEGQIQSYSDVIDRSIDRVR